MSSSVINTFGGGNTNKLFKWKKCSYTPAVIANNPSFTLNGGGSKYSIYQITNANFDISLLPSMGGTKESGSDVPAGASLINNTNSPLIRAFFNGFTAGDATTLLGGETTLTLTASYQSHNTYNFNAESHTDGWFSAYYSINCATISNKTFSYNGDKILTPESYDFVEYVESNYYDAYPKDGFAEDGYYYVDVSFTNSGSRLVYNSGEYSSGFYGFPFDSVSANGNTLSTTFFPKSSVSGNRSIIQIKNNKALMVYGIDYTLKAVVMTFSDDGSTIAYGTEVDIGPGYENGLIQIDDDRCFIAYSGWGTYGLFGAILTIDNDAITVSTPVLINNKVNNFDYNSIQLEVHNNKIGILGRYVYSSYYFMLGAMIEFDISNDITVLSLYDGGSLVYQPYFRHYHDTTFVSYQYDSSNYRHYAIIYDWENDRFATSTTLATSTYIYPMVYTYGEAFDDNLVFLGSAANSSNMCSILVTSDGIDRVLTVRNHSGLSVTTGSVSVTSVFCKLTDNCMVHTSDGNNIRLIKVDKEYNVTFNELGYLADSKDTSYYTYDLYTFKADNTTALIYGKRQYNYGSQYANYITRVGVSGDIKTYESSVYSYCSPVTFFMRLNSSSCVVLDTQKNYNSTLVYMTCPVASPSADGKPVSVFFAKDKNDNNVFYLY